MQNFGASSLPLLSLDRWFLQGAAHLSVRWELAGGFFGIDLFAVGEHLEAAIIIGGKGEVADTLFVLGE